MRWALPPSRMRTRVELGIDVHVHDPIGSLLFQDFSAPTITPALSPWSTIAPFVRFKWILNACLPVRVFAGKSQAMLGESVGFSRSPSHAQMLRSLPSISL